MKTLLILIMLAFSSVAIAEHPNDIVPDALLYDYVYHNVKQGNIIMVADKGVVIRKDIGKMNYLEDSGNPHSDIGIPDALYGDN